MRVFLLLLLFTCKLVWAESFGNVNLSAAQLQTGGVLPEGVVYGFGYGGKKIFDNGMTVGANLFFHYGSVEKDTQNDTVAALGSEFLLGYQYKDFSVFGVVSGMEQDYKNLQSAGFGYGGGVEWSITKRYGCVLEYVTHSMITDTPLTYDAQITKFAVEIYLH